MDVNLYSYPPGDPQLIDKICHEFLSQGRFDRLRKECMANADTKVISSLQFRIANHFKNGSLSSQHIKICNKELKIQFHNF